jgi:hypothetical protein
VSNIAPSQVTQHEAFTRLLVENGISTKQEFLDIARVVDQGIRTERTKGG